MLEISDLKKELQRKASKKKAKTFQRFFKTGPGEYGQGDVFLGISVPDIRKIAKKYNSLGLKRVIKLLHSKIHEERLAALFIMINKFQVEENKKKICELYLKNTKYINNWDLVDCSASHILGNWLLRNNRSILYKLAKSENLWERRISIIATLSFIKENDFKDTLKISQILLNDKHDLIHKAVGWMLREVGKRDLKAEERFLKKHYKKMPRTMLRYAIERFSEHKRQDYLKSKIH